jgi:glucose-6-phosphate dehydrogenase assembly protein OpcA
MTASDGHAAHAAVHEQAVHRRLMRFGEADTLATPMWESRNTSVREVAGYLTRLWDVSAPRATGGEPTMIERGVPHGRASVLNLIVTVVDDAAAERVVRTLMGLGVRHPSRAIVLVPQHGMSGAALDARISTHCHDAPGGGERICYEEVVLTVRGEAADHLSGVVAPLLIHDLPTYVWWPGNPPFADPVFGQLVDLADRLIVDSADSGDLGTCLRRLSGLRRRSGVGDLAWGRLARWQELTAQFFDAPRFRRYLPNLSRLHVTYAVAPASGGAAVDDRTSAPGVPSPLVEPLLYAGWIATRLAWRRSRTEESLSDGRLRLRMEGRYEMVDLLIEPIETIELPPGELLSVHLGVLGEAGAAEFIVDRSGDEATVATNADGMTALLRRVVLEPIGEPELLSGQLGTEGVDRVYEDALRAASIIFASAREAAA